jgi:hypothetical protein
VQQSKRFQFLALALLVLLIAGGMGGYTHYLRNSCDLKAVEEASTVLIRQRNRYDHSYQFAVTATRDAIVRPVVELQQILMDTQQVTVPACMQTAKQELIDYMGTVLRAFASYGAGESDAMVRDLVNESQVHYDNFTTELEDVRECAPLCIR